VRPVRSTDGVVLRASYLLLRVLRTVHPLVCQDRSLPLQHPRDPVIVSSAPLCLLPRPRRQNHLSVPSGRAVLHSGQFLGVQMRDHRPPVLPELRRLFLDLPGLDEGLLVARQAAVAASLLVTGARHAPL
jgi:hypothetical protein